MPTFLITLWAAILSLFGRAVAAPATAPAPRIRTRNRVRRRAPPHQARRVRLSRVTGPRRALRLIADTVGQVSGVPRQPHDSHDLEVAWLMLGDPVAGFVQSLVALGATIPRLLDSQDEDAQFEQLVIRAKRSPRTFIKAIRREFPIRSSAEATRVLAHRVQRLFRGAVPKPERTPGPAGEREWHVVDSMDRPVICQILEHEDGHLEILDGLLAGFLHRDTLALSCWRLVEGWLLAPGYRNRRRNDGDGAGLPLPEPRPNAIQPRM